MIHLFRKRTKTLVTLVLGVCAWSGVFPGIYAAYASATTAEAIASAAQQGSDYGTGLLGDSSADASSDGQTDFDNLGMTSPAGWKSKLESYYVPDNVGRARGAKLNQYADGWGAVLDETSCPSAWGTADSDLNTASSDYQQAVSVCGQRIASFVGMAEQQTADSALVTEAQGDASSWQSDVNSANTVIKTITQECQEAPACDVTTTSGAESIASVWTSTSAGYPKLVSYCDSLPSKPAASQLSGEEADIASVINTFNNLGYGNSSIKSFGAKCSYAISYKASESGMQNLNALTNPGSAYGDTMNISDFSSMTFANGETGQDIENEMLPLIEGNPDVFKQYYSSSDCSETTTYFTNQGGTATTPSTTVIHAGSNSNKPVACNTSGEHNGWVTDFPDPHAEYIWGGYNDCSSVPNGDTETFESVYNNGGNGSTQNAPISATLYLAIDDQGTVTIQGSAKNETEQVTYSDDGGDPVSANPPDGWISEPVTIYPGTNVITITDKNDDSGTSAANPAGALMSIINSSGQVLIDTNTTQWNWVNAATNPVTTTQEPGQTVNTGAPSASATSDICKNTVSCLGTQCHAIMGNQNLDFNKAVTASSALSMMQTDIKCAKGTSVKAGNCIPLVFTGRYYFCRTWPFSSVGITNNCCKEGMEGQGLPIGKAIQLTMDVYNFSANKLVQGTILGDPADWTDSAYKAMSTWGSDAWNFVSSPFVNLAEDFMQSVVTPVETYLGLSTKVASVVGQDAASAGSSVASVFSVVDDFESVVVAKMEAYAAEAINGLTDCGLNAANAMVTEIAGFANLLMLAYTAYQILQLIGQLLTACKKEEFTFGNYRKDDDCYIVGTYCAEHSPIIGCIMHKTTACCYQSPLAMIIASQIQTGQPNVAGGYGSAKKPNCVGFTIQDLAKVNWNDINLSAWMAIIEKAGLIQNGNRAASAAFNRNTQEHPSGRTKVSS